MSFTKVNPAGWATNELLTHTQITTLDSDHSYAWDNRTGQTNTVGSITSLSGAGRILSAFATGSDANANITVGNSNNVIRVSSLTANRTYTLQTTGAVANDSIAFFIDVGVGTYEVTIKDQASATLFVLGNLSSSDGQWFEAFYTGSAWLSFLRGGGARLRMTQLTGSGNFTVPPGVTEAIIAGGGGGGGGASGFGSGVSGVNRRHCGGGGGGGAHFKMVRVPMTPGASCPYVVGSGGAGGTGGGPTTINAGSDGTDSTFNTTISFHTARFYGASGGGIGNTGAVANTESYQAVGGMPVKGLTTGAREINYGNGWAAVASDMWPQVDSQGGGSLGASVGLGRAGATNSSSRVTTTAGAGGASGSDSTYMGGSGGGGGAAGFSNNGGGGGNGGAGGGGSGGNATDGGDLTGLAGGAGGGGGGGAGIGSGSNGNTGTGGGGANGELFVLWVK